LPETEQERWNYSAHKYQARTTSLGTYKCWKCKRVGHLPEDCTAFLGVAAPSPDNPNSLVTPLPPHQAAGEGGSGIYSPELTRLYPNVKIPPPLSLIIIDPIDIKNARKFQQEKATSVGNVGLGLISHSAWIVVLWFATTNRIYYAI
jgi:hypothetical protein